MCDECGCGDEMNAARVVTVERSVNDANDRRASEIVEFLKSRGVFCVNIMGSPGAGKTTLIEHVSDILGVDSVAVIQGDLESDVDKRRLESQGILTYQINTHSGCHLNAEMVRGALDSLDLSGKKFLFIENVGNLVCPAGVSIGQHMNMVVSSTAEGSDKPRKYPIIFMDAGLVVVSKMDIADACGFDMALFEADVRRANSRVRIVPVCAKDGAGFADAAHVILHWRDHLLGIGHGH